MPPPRPLAAALVALKDVDPAAVLDGTSTGKRPDPAATTPQGIHRVVRAVAGIAMERGLVVVALASYALWFRFRNLTPYDV